VSRAGSFSGSVLAPFGGKVSLDDLYNSNSSDGGTTSTPGPPPASPPPPSGTPTVTPPSVTNVPPVEAGQPPSGAGQPPAGFDENFMNYYPYPGGHPVGYSTGPQSGAPADVARQYGAVDQARTAGAPEDVLAQFNSYLGL
jgi:hypothetical protein